MKFRLTRVYSIASLVGILVIVLGLGLLYRHVAVTALVEHASQQNVALTQTFANALWPKYARFVEGALDPATLAARPEIAELDAAIRDMARNLPVVKVKIYDLAGLTVYSSEKRQIGEDKSGNRGFRQARAGTVASELVHRDHFSAFEQTVEDRNVMSSYVPIRRTPEGAVEGVFEIYADVTPLVSEIGRTGQLILGAVAALMLLLYAFLYVVVHRADRVIRQHEDEERQAQRSRIRYLAYHDALTGLANRALFRDRLQHAVEQARRQGALLGLMFIDFDRFKIVNDSLGHEAGDRVLVECARRIRTVLREADTAGRMGGDEFTVLLENLTSTAMATQVAERTLEAFAEPMRVDDRDIVVTPSIGITVYPETTRDPARLLTDADIAMRRAKESGRNRYVFYTAELDAQVRIGIEHATDLRQALARGEFALFYQPQVDVGSGSLVGMEALLRWQHPTDGLLPPERFVPLLEDTGLTVPVGEWALREACRQCRAWRDAGHTGLRVSVNVSPRQAQSRAMLVAGVRAALAQSGLTPGGLELEFTEGALLGSAAQVLAQLRELKDAGVRLTIDDFGMGYSSLGYLTHFPIDSLKIDRAFVRDVAADRGNAAVTTAILTLARSLGLGVVAQGIEAREQALFLYARGCDVMQRHLFSAPLPGTEFEALAPRDLLRQAGLHDAVLQRRPEGTAVA